MARKKSLTLTDAELRIMEVVWKKGEVTVAEVAEELDAPAEPSDDQGEEP